MSHAHIESALKQYQNIIEMHAVTFALPQTPDYTRDVLPKNREKMNFLIDKLIQHMNDTFAPPTEGAKVDEVELAECSKLWNVNPSMPYAEARAATHAHIQKLWDIPPTMLETIIPIAILRDMLALRRLPYNPSTGIMIKGRRVKPFDLFASRYCHLVLAA